MKHGFIKAAAVIPKIKVADPEYNAGQICKKIEEAYEKQAKIIVLPRQMKTLPLFRFPA